jgi:hypothetical protein
MMVLMVIIDWTRVVQLDATEAGRLSIFRVYCTTWENPHTAGEYGIGMAFHHKHFKLWCIRHQQDSRCGSNGNKVRIKIGHKRYFLESEQ